MKALNAIVILMFCAAAAAAALERPLSDIKVEDLEKPASLQWGRDPFLRFEDRYKKAAPAPEVLLPSGLKINGIISDGKKALAIINGGFYRKGDMVYDFRIEDITKSKVVLVKGGVRFSLGVEKFAIESIRGAR